MDKWKVIAIVFIILFVTETTAFGYAIYTGKKQIDNDTQCNSICYELESYKYDYQNDLCKCFNYGEEEPFHMEIIK